MINFKFKHRVISVFAMIAVLVIFMASCEEDNKPTNPNDTTKKDSVIDTASFAQKVFELYVLNKATRIKLAIDTGGINITPDFSDMVIYLRKETFYNGPLEILANGTKYIGTWSSNYDYSFLDLSIEGLPQFKYFEKTWRFKYKSLDLLILVPRSNPLKKEMHLEHL
jgi:hypothetical protein